MPMPLALGLDLVMNRPNRVRFVDLPSEGKLRAQEADKRKHTRWVYVFATHEVCAGCLG